MRKTDPESYVVEMFDIASLTPHPRNYVVHPPEELEQLIASLKLHGIYKNIVVAKDRTTILAGHGLVEALVLMRKKKVPGKVVPWAPIHPNALKILAGDNMIPLLADRDDRAVTDLLKDIYEQSGDLAGTGLDEKMLANLVFVTRPASEIQGLDEAAHWVGLPEYPDAPAGPIHATLNFLTEADRKRCSQLLGIDLTQRKLWWPARKRDDLKSLRFKAEK